VRGWTAHGGDSHRVCVSSRSDLRRPAVVSLIFYALCTCCAVDIHGQACQANQCTWRPAGCARRLDCCPRRVASAQRSRVSLRSGSGCQFYAQGVVAMALAVYVFVCTRTWSRGDPVPVCLVFLPLTLQAHFILDSNPRGVTHSHARGHTIVHEVVNVETLTCAFHNNELDLQHRNIDCNVSRPQIAPIGSHAYAHARVLPRGQLQG
jgi:hypothetical protein